MTFRRSIKRRPPTKSALRRPAEPYRPFRAPPNLNAALKRPDGLMKNMARRNRFKHITWSIILKGTIAGLASLVAVGALHASHVLPPTTQSPRAARPAATLPLAPARRGPRTRTGIAPNTGKVVRRRPAPVARQMPGIGASVPVGGVPSVVLPSSPLTGPGVTAPSLPPVTIPSSPVTLPVVTIPSIPVTVPTLKPASIKEAADAADTAGHNPFGRSGVRVESGQHCRADVDCAA